MNKSSRPSQHQPQPHAMQHRTAMAPRKSKAPVAPPAYRPQPVPKVLQRKVATPNQPHNSIKPGPVAPPVYRPQPTPVVLQPKKVRTPAAPPSLQTKALNPREQYGHDTKQELVSFTTRAACHTTVSATSVQANRHHAGSVVQRKLHFAGEEAPTKPQYVQSRDDVYDAILKYVHEAMDEVNFFTEDRALVLRHELHFFESVNVISNEKVKLCVGAILGRLIRWAGDDQDRLPMNIPVAVRAAAQSLTSEPLLMKIAHGRLAVLERRRLEEERQREEEERKRLAELPILDSDPDWLRALIRRFVGIVPGVKRFTDAVRDAVLTGNYAFQAGYEYQARIALELGENLAGLEVSYQGTLTPDRYVDLMTRDGAMIECKVFAGGGEPAEGIMKEFFIQALDYSRSQTRVNYRFKNGVPDWARQLLYCAKSWGNGPILVSGNPVAFPIVFGGKNDVPIVKKAKGWYQDALHHVPPPLE